MRTSDVVKSYLGLLCLGISDYDAIENFRRDTPLRQLLTLQMVPSTAALRQRQEKLAARDLQARTATWSTTLLSLVEAPITAETGYVCQDIDTFVMDNRDTRKKGVSRTYQKIDGYTPIAVYLGNEGWCLGLELRPGRQHTMKESNAFLKRVLPRAHALTAQPILVREDSGFDSQALWTQTVSITDGKTEHELKRVMRLVERTAETDGQQLLVPDDELEGWWTSLEETPEAVIQIDALQQKGTT